MEPVLAAVEMTGTVDEQQHIQLDEAEWLYAAARNPAFGFLHDLEESVYTLEDGKPLDVEVQGLARSVSQG